MSCCAKGKAAANNNPILAKGWEEFWSNEYQLPYYFHKKLKKTQWEHPGYSLPNGKPIKLKKIVSLEEGMESKKPKKHFQCTFTEGPLGLKLREDMDMNGNMIIEVWDVVPEGQADNTGRINVKDRLSKIGGRDCNLMELPEILRAIKACGRPLTLEFRKPPTKAEQDAITAAVLKRAEEKKRLEEEERKERELKELKEKERQMQEQKELEAKELRRKRKLEEEKRREKDEQAAREVREKEEQEAKELREKEEKEARELREKEEKEAAERQAKAEQEARELKEKEEREAKEAKEAEEARKIANENGQREIFTFLEGPMGMILGDGENDEDGAFVELLSKVEGSKAANESTLLLGDRIVKVANTPVKGLDFEHVMNVLKSAERPVEITFLHPNGNIRRNFLFQDGPMGMTLEDDTDVDGNDIVKVAVIKEESQAAKIGNLEVNDCIVAIGGESVVGFHFDKIMTILTAATRPVKLTFMRPPKVEEYVYTFEAGPIGLVLGDSINEKTGNVFVGVVSKKPGSAAARYDGLKENDQITHIGKQKVKGLDFAHVMEILKKEPRPMNLTFTRPLAVGVVSLHTDGAAGMEKKAAPPSQPASAPQAEPTAAEPPSTPSGEAKPESTPMASTVGAAKKDGSVGGKKRPSRSSVGGKKTPGSSAAAKTPRGSSGGKKRTSVSGSKSAGGKRRSSNHGKKQS